MGKLMTAEQVEEYFTRVWGRQAWLNAYRISGNRTAYAVIDHGENWQRVNTCWINGQQFFSL